MSRFAYLMGRFDETQPRTFLATHTGSLRVPRNLIRMRYAKEEGVPSIPMHGAPRRIASG